MKSYLASCAALVIMYLFLVNGAPRVQINDALTTKLPVKTTTTTTSATTTTNTKTQKDNGVETEDEAFEYLVKFGYVKPPTSKDGTPEIESIVDIGSAIKKLQTFAGLPATGKLDDATKKLMNSPRCHLPDVTAPIKPKSKRFSAMARWRKNKLSYNIQNSPSRSYNIQDSNTASQAISTAFNDWSSVANLNFQKVTSGNADINVGFYRGNHGDGDSFDGEGVVLAHAFFPEDGRLHFDDDEKWSTNGYGVNLRQVATHEIGHIIGLGHTNVLGAVMYPYYKYMTDFKLASDDVKGATYLYGSQPNAPGVTNVPQQPKTTTTTRRPRWYNWWWSNYYKK